MKIILKWPILNKVNEYNIVEFDIVKVFSKSKNRLEY